MILKLDPALPVVWRTPSDVQIGADEPVCVIADVSPTAERLLAALDHGAPRQALVMIATRHGESATVVDDLLRSLSPALVRPEPLERPGRVTVVGTGAEADRLRRTLAEYGVIAGAPAGGEEDAAEGDAAGADGADGGTEPGITAVVADYVVDPASFAALMRRDVVHLPIVFGDRYVEVGPLIVPGETACLRCLSLHRRDRDPAWPAIAAQLVSHRAPTRGGLAATEAIAHATRILTTPSARRDATRTAARSTRIDSVTGEVTEPQHLPHPECGCRTLPESATAHVRPLACLRPTPS